LYKRVHLLAAKELVEKGKAEVNVANKDGMTPLHWVTLKFISRVN
jgi:ankyrin repeat protein